MEKRINRRLAAIMAADIAGYSRLMGEDEAATVRDLKGHQAEVLPLVAEFGGRIIDLAGDGILAEFQSAVAVVECAMQIQTCMARRNVGVSEARCMRFRIGINLGEVVHDEARIYGDGINIAARLENLAAPGGISVSAKVREEVEGKLTLAFNDLGLQTLKNIAKPVQVYALTSVSDGTPLPHPVVASTPATSVAETSGWLPAAMTPLLGRMPDMDHALLLLKSNRCLTLTGAGGSGKTRLALALADSARPQYPGGTWWVSLDALHDPALLAQTLASAVGCTNLMQPAVQALTERLAGRRTLLVLDNCEHLVDNCADLATELLRQLPLLHLLNTSRESLRLAGEVVYSVLPLDVPGAAVEDPQELLQHASVQLLIDRIRRHSPGFELTPGNAASLAHICRGLEGLPLALELVAAQIGPQTPAQVASRLDRSLALLNVGLRGGVRHHQTMVAAVDWSYQLLGQLDQAVFLRLSVFSGGWTLDSAGAACADLGLSSDELEEAVGRLVRASMVLAATSEAAVRFRMLEPVRQFAAARLEKLALVSMVKRQLLAWYGLRAKSLAAQLAGPAQAEGYAFLVPEFDNLRALLAFSKLSDVNVGLQMACDLWRFWQVKGHAKEMLTWFEEVLAQAQNLPDALRADASNTAGVMARTCGDYTAAARLHLAAADLHCQGGNRRGELIALNNLCLIARDQYDHAQVEQLGQQNLQLARAIADRVLEGLSLMHLGFAAHGQDQRTQAEAHFEQSFAIFSELGDRRTLAALHNFLGRLALDDGRWPEAERRFAQSLEINHEVEDFWGLGISTSNSAALHVARGEDEAALQVLLLSLAHYRRAGAQHGVEECFELLAGLAYRRGRLQRAAWCWGVVDRLECEMGTKLTPAQGALREQAQHALRTEMSAEAFSAARAEGLRVPLHDAFAAVLPEGGLD